MAESRHSLPSYRAKGYRGQRDINVKFSIDKHKRIKWNVCVLKPNKWFKHHTMLFESVTTSDKFTVELLAGSEVLFRCRNFDTSNLRYSQLRKEVLGVCTASARSLIATAISVLKQQGDYHETYNNCQDYCKALAKKLDCDDYWGDREKAGVMGGGIFAAALAVGLAVVLFIAGGLNRRR